jgi:UDP-glucose 4-epimerase
MVKTWLITGGNGFVGINLRDSISKKYPEDRITVVDVKNHNRSFVDRAKWININVANFRAMDKVFMKYKPNYVVHLAAETKVRESMSDPKRFIEKNVVGTLNCLELARRYDCESVIVASSCGVAGEHFCCVNEETRPDPLSPYSASKLCSEQISNCYMKLGVDVCNLRFSNIFGPWSDHKTNAIPLFIKAFLSGESLKINGSGNQTRNFIYIKDVVSSIFSCVKKKAMGTYCIASDKSLEINDIVSIICDAGGNDAEVEFLDPADGDITSIEVDNSKARRELMFQCEYSIVEGIIETMQWFEELKLEPLLEKI